MSYNTYDTDELRIKRTGNKTHTYHITCVTKDKRISFTFKNCKSVHFDFEDDGDDISAFFANQSIAKTNKGIELAIINPLMGEEN